MLLLQSLFISPNQYRGVVQADGVNMPRLNGPDETLRFLFPQCGATAPGPESEGLTTAL